MKKNRSLLKTFLFLNGAALGGLALVNRVVSKRAVSGDLLKKNVGRYYHWKHANVFYRVSGKGEKPLVLLHTVSEVSSAYEWHSVTRALGEKYRVYTVDLPGCGRSDKPALSYTNFFYVSFLRDFLRDVVGEKSVVAASRLSGTYALTTALWPDTLIDKLVLINPPAPSEMAAVPDNTSVLVRRLVSLPIIGEAIYNIITSKPNIEYLFEEHAYYNPFNFDTRTIAICNEAAHKGKGSGRFLRASLDGRLFHWNLEYALRHVDMDVEAIFTDRWDGVQESREQYQKLRPSIRFTTIPNAGLLPQLEQPDAFSKVLLEIG